MYIHIYNIYIYIYKHIICSSGKVPFSSMFLLPLKARWSRIVQHFLQQATHDLLHDWNTTRWPGKSGWNQRWPMGNPRVPRYFTGKFFMENYGKSPFAMEIPRNYGTLPFYSWVNGKSSISMAIFNSCVNVYQRVFHDFFPNEQWLLKPCWWLL